MVAGGPQPIQAVEEGGGGGLRGQLLQLRVPVAAV